ncbi:hypothetical protein G5714_024746 [Onychostoma macrolepis]|uniref:Uncharacterized protein n=1 Tax=Onychostoma macrolepis TaxID=369639 RepID=A0A7J6BLG7_9TELE|nr:hypothetical protein G5714_024746 [Onychostoma macrolepis]
MSGSHKPVIPVVYRPSQTPHLPLSPGQVAPGTTWAPGLGLQKREPAGGSPPCLTGARLESSSTGSSFPADSAKPVPLAVVSLDSRALGRNHISVNTRRGPSRCFVLIKQSDSLVRTSSKPAAGAARGARAARPGTPPGGGRAPRRRSRRAVAGEIREGPGAVQSRRPRARTPRRPRPARRRGHPDTPQPDATPHPGHGLPERGHRLGGQERGGGAWRLRGGRQEGARRRSQHSGPARRTSARPTQPLEPILIPKLRI